MQNESFSISQAPVVTATLAAVLTVFVDQEATRRPVTDESSTSQRTCQPVAADVSAGLFTYQTEPFVLTEPVD